MEKVAFYSVLVGGYDRQWAVRVDPEVACYLFTDGPSSSLRAPWKRLAMPPRGELTLRQWSRLVKICPHRYLPPHDISVYGDANLRWFKSPGDWARTLMAQGADFALPRHPNRGCLYAEARRVLELGYDNLVRVQGTLARLRAAGFPENVGLGENCLLIRRNTPEVQAIGEEWLADYLAGSVRDQLSLMPVLWRRRARVCWIPEHSRQNAYYVQKPHQGNRRLHP